MDGGLEFVGVGKVISNQFIYQRAVDHVYIRSTVLQGGYLPFGEALSCELEGYLRGEGVSDVKVALE